MRRRRASSSSSFPRNSLAIRSVSASTSVTRLPKCFPSFTIDMKHKEPETKARRTRRHKCADTRKSGQKNRQVYGCGDINGEPKKHTHTFIASYCEDRILDTAPPPPCVVPPPCTRVAPCHTVGLGVYVGNPPSETIPYFLGCNVWAILRQKKRRGGRNVFLLLQLYATEQRRRGTIVDMWTRRQKHEKKNTHTHKTVFVTSASILKTKNADKNNTHSTQRK